MSENSLQAAPRRSSLDNTGISQRRIAVMRRPRAFRPDMCQRLCRNAMSPQEPLERGSNFATGVRDKLMIKFSSVIQTALRTDCANKLEEILAVKSETQLKELIDALADDELSPQMRQRAVYLLGRFEEPAAIEPILNVVAKLDALGRVAAADALGRLGSQRCLDALIKLSSDPAPDVRKFSTRALRRIGGAKARKRLEEVVQSERETFVRDTAERELSKMN